MAFKANKNNGYSAQLAKDLLGDETIYIVGVNLVTQYEYVDEKRTENVTGYQVWVNIPSQDPFKVKFTVDNQPDLSKFTIGDVVEFEGLEAIKIRTNYYFKATKIKKVG